MRPVNPSTPPVADNEKVYTNSLANQFDDSRRRHDLLCGGRGFYSKDYRRNRPVAIRVVCPLDYAD